MRVGADPAKVRAILDGSEAPANPPAPGDEGRSRPRADDGNPPGHATFNEGDDLL